MAELRLEIAETLYAHGIGTDDSIAPAGLLDALTALFDRWQREVKEEPVEYRPKRRRLPDE